MKAKRSFEFLNVDLEIVSRSKLDAIETGVRDLAHALYCGPAGKKGMFLLALECNEYPKNSDAGILVLCTAVDRLGKAERRLWDRALSRTFDVGYNLEVGVRLVRATVRSKTLARVVALGATVAFSCYREVGSEPGAAPLGGPTPPVHHSRTFGGPPSVS